MPVLGVYSALALLVLLPVLIGVLAAFGVFLYALTGIGAFGWFLDAFLLLALAAIVAAILKVGA